MPSSTFSSPAAAPAKIRVMLVDDHTLFRTALRHVLETCPTIEITGEAADGAQAIGLISERAPDFVCMDLRLPVLDGAETTRRLRLSHPGIKVIGLSGYPEPDAISIMLDAGAVAYVPKMDASDDLIRTILDWHGQDAAGDARGR